MLRVLVTDAGYKNAIALARYAKRAIPDLHVIGHDARHRHLPGWYGCYDELVSGAPLESALSKVRFDMAIPVGASSVLSVASHCPERAVLPSRESLETSFDKDQTIALAKSLEVPVPRTWLARNPGDAARPPMAFPCVVKPSKEGTGVKSVNYCHTPRERAKAIASQLARLRGQAGVLVQEYIEGHGVGLFALMNHGMPVRLFMHRRIREYPPTGGRSTAACAFHSERLKELGLKLLSALDWHGVAMVEFKYSEARQDFVLMEINGKFWGSLELALSAGVNFGADLIRLFQGEALAYTEEFDRDHKFYWPLDGDLLTLLKTRSLRRIADYWQADAHTNLFQSLRADAFKILCMGPKLAGDAVLSSLRLNSPSPVSGQPLLGSKTVTD